MLTCVVCDTDIVNCTCPGKDAALKRVAFDPKNVNVAFKWCRQCDKHYARCKCDKPDFFVVCAGQELDASGGFRNAEGGRTYPDLTTR